MTIEEFDELLIDSEFDSDNGDKKYEVDIPQNHTTNMKLASDYVISGASDTIAMRIIGNKGYVITKGSTTYSLPTAVEVI